ncbi:hypothetical protein RDABS01_038156 [Bienertia sinuspersici]
MVFNVVRFWVKAYQLPMDKRKKSMAEAMTNKMGKFVDFDSSDPFDEDIPENTYPKEAIMVDAESLEGSRKGEVDETRKNMERSNKRTRNLTGSATVEEAKNRNKNVQPLDVLSAVEMRRVWEKEKDYVGLFIDSAGREGGLGGAPREQSLLDEFRLALEDCELMDLGYVGLQQTWWNGQDGGGRVYERLDRMVGNERWMEEFPLLCVYHPNKGNSDHFPFKLIECKRQSKKRQRGSIFRFEDFWLTSSMCQEVVSSAWQNTSLGLLLGRLDCVTHALKRWFNVDRWETSASGKKNEVWHSLWKLLIPPKVKVFMRRACNNALPTSKGLSKRVPSVERWCAECSFLEEDIMHAIFKFPRAAVFWRAKFKAMFDLSFQWSGTFTEWWCRQIDVFDAAEA